MQTIIIIGGWPAGLMTATRLLESEKKCKIILLEANSKLGRKLVISGGGRCNVTTGIFDKKILREKYTRGFDFFEKILGEFWPKKTIKFFEENGLPLYTQDDFRVFPKSNNGEDVLEFFEKIFAKNSDRIEIKFGEKVTKTEKIGEKFVITTQKNNIFESDFLVIATGWNAYAKTGSTGDGYGFAKDFGHTITTLGPSLSSFLIAENFLKELSGISFLEAKISFQTENPKTQKHISGSLLFTHFGISGPLAFMLSSHLAWENSIKNLQIKFSPISDYDTKNWDNFLKEEFGKSPKKKIFAILSEKLPKRFAEIFIENFCKSISEKMVGEINKKDRENIAKILGDGIVITLLDRRPWDEFVTAGGVNTDEINAKTLESKICKNLFFAGEILNIDGYTGGFSLQICWSTGYKIGKIIAEKL